MADNDRWYAGEMDKNVCNKLVLAGPSGSFLVRVSSAGDRYVIVINDHGTAGPYQVKITPSKRLLWREDEYNTLADVVNNIRANPFKGMSKKIIELGKPASGGDLHESVKASSSATDSYNPFAVPPPPTEPAANAEDYVLYQALYTYRNDDPDDLNFDANDIVQVTDEDEYPKKCWMEGRSQDGLVGSFPSTYVRKIEMKATTKSVDSYGS